jgi:hypothetical protein
VINTIKGKVCACQLKEATVAIVPQAQRAGGAWHKDAEKLCTSPEGVTVVNANCKMLAVCRKQQCATDIREGLRARAMTHWRSIAACVDAHVGEAAARWDLGTTSAAVSLVHNVVLNEGRTPAVTLLSCGVQL